MSWSLREVPEAIAAAAERVESAIGIPMAHVEKDFWVTEVLRGIAKCSGELGVSAVFKGGTSLSKSFGLIQRFSEDVDMIVVTTGQTLGRASSGDRTRLRRSSANRAARARPGANARREADDRASRSDRRGRVRTGAPRSPLLRHLMPTRR